MMSRSDATSSRHRAAPKAILVLVRDINPVAGIGSRGWHNAVNILLWAYQTQRLTRVSGQGEPSVRWRAASWDIATASWVRLRTLRRVMRCVR